MADEMSEHEAEELLRAFGESKSTIHSFLTNIVKAEDTTRIANIKDEELGQPILPVRTYLELATFARDVGMTEFADYFDKMKEVVTAPSLSREGFLIRQATIQRKEFSDTTKRKKEKKGLFSKKESSEEQEV